ncbi:OPT oligopeptide transporter protein [bacterium BMS3Abin05]|nr:OPT oligopeptide transporter protein [bacterium BMS3Abin05]
MANKEFKPYVPIVTDLREFTPKAIILGVVLALVLGAANAYVGMKAGMTVAATFPAAVIAIAVLRPFKGSILEENIARTTASVGEALVAGAIFTIPAFLLSGVWQHLHYWESTIIMFVGGTLGVLFVVLLRRALIEEADLPFPESVACGEIVKAGQKGHSGASYVFGAMGLASFLELFKNSRGIQVFVENFSGFIRFKQSAMQLFNEHGKKLGSSISYGGGIFWKSPAASSALVGVGYIIGPRLANITFSGGVFGWLLLIPMATFFNTNLAGIVGSSPHANWYAIGNAVWYYQIRPIAVGAMLVGAFYTLWNLRKSLVTGIGKGIADARKAKQGEETGRNRWEKDLPFNQILIAVIVLAFPMFLIYNHFSGNIVSAIVVTLVMLLLGFLFAAVAGYLVGVIGSSSNPISGLALSTLIIAAVLMVAMGTKGIHGIEAVLGVTAVVCVMAGIAGDMMQDLKVGQILGGTPWKMEAGEIIGVIIASLVMVWPITILNEATPGGIGGELLPAPQAGLMALIAKGIVGGHMAWPLVIVGMMFSVGLILIKSPSPMLIAVGMYLPFQTTAAIWIGGIFKWALQTLVKRKNFSESKRETAENTGILVASGLVAGEALTGVILAGLYLAHVRLPLISKSPWIGLLVFPILYFVMIVIPLRRATREA